MLSPAARAKSGTASSAVQPAYTASTAAAAVKDGGVRGWHEMRLFVLGLLRRTIHIINHITEKYNERDINIWFLRHVLAQRG